MDRERAVYNIYSEMQLHTFGDFYRKTYKPQYPICVKTGIGRGLRNESIASFYSISQIFKIRKLNQTDNPH